MSDKNLKPCPFCGCAARLGKTVVEDNPNNRYWFINCVNAQCGVETFQDTQNTVIHQWNTRAESKQIAELESDLKFMSEQLAHINRYPEMDFVQICAVIMQSAASVAKAFPKSALKIRDEINRLKTWESQQFKKTAELEATLEKVEAENERLKEIRKCESHGESAHAWGCPECVRELRIENERLKGELKLGKYGEMLVKNSTAIQESTQHVKKLIAENITLKEEIERLKKELTK